MSSVTTQRPFKAGQGSRASFPTTKETNGAVPPSHSARSNSRESNDTNPNNGTASMDYDQVSSYNSNSNPMSHLETTLQNPQIQSPPFPFEDFLTPEYSSENLTSDLSAHTTPGVDGYTWDYPYADPPLHQTLHNISTGQEAGPLFSSATTNDSQRFTSQPGKYSSRSISGSQLLSPQLTTTPSPPEPANAELNNSSGRAEKSLFAPDAGKMTKRKTDSDFLHLQTSSDPYRPGKSNHASLEPSPTEPVARAVSPVVMVSSYTRGDSPARSRVPLERTASKRSHGSRTSDLLAPHTSHGSEEDVAPAPEYLTSNLVTSARDHEESDENTGYDRAGLDPGQRGEELVPSLQEIEENRKRQEKNADVETWLAKSETGSQIGEEEPHRKLGRRKSQKDRVRSRSTGAPVDALGIRHFDDTHIPGPGVLVAEESDGEHTDDEGSQSRSQSDMNETQSPEPPSPPAHVDPTSHVNESEYFPPAEDIPPEEQEPLPRQFYRRTPWQDPVRGTGPNDSRDQPPSSNAAIFRYDQQAAKFETASRAATWGTRRRLSETEVSSIVEGSKIRHLSLSKRGRERGASFINKLMPRRTPSTSKPKPPETPEQETPIKPEHKRGDSLTNAAPLQRMTSVGKSRSPARAAGNAIMAITGRHLTAAGRSTSATPETAAPSSPFHILKRNRSKSELPKNGGKGKETLGLAQLMTQHGGPPMPTLASPMQERRASREANAPRVSDDEDEDDDDDDDDLMNDKGATMDFKVRADNIIPTLEGFKTHARQLNPRLEPFLIDRIGQEQLRRYKKLVDNRVKHTQAVLVHKKCASGKHCFDLNGEATLLPPRTNAKDPEMTYTQFQIIGHGDTDEDEIKFAEGVVTPALFPSGIPLPPVKLLPAEFECPLCFKVKAFQKPSDWTKHVHEDVQPFSCTFPNCTDPKSFKRKADWVRHENERHRHLEWWQCNRQECNHICYRKDNFVQHLVREHKLPEPKVKRGSGSSKTKVANGSNWQGSEVDEVWRLLDVCHHDTPKKAKDEICKFCGNMCNTWKKVSSHLGKHMEQIALPVLELVKQREVSPDTIVSPIEQSYQSQMSMVPAHTNMMYGDNQGNLSPYPMSAASHYQGSSGGHSPVTMHPYPQGSQTQYVAGYQSGMGPRAQMQAHSPDMTEYATMGSSPSNMAYSAYANVTPTHNFVPINSAPYPSAYPTVRRSPLQPQAQTQIPRSQPVQHDMRTMQLETVNDAMYHPHPPQEVIYSSPVDAQQYMTQYGQPVAQHHHMTQVTSQMGFEPTAATKREGMSREAMYADAQQLGNYQMPGSHHAGHGYPPY